MHNRPAPPLQLTPQQRSALLDWSRSPVMPQCMVLRARIVLASADGEPVSRIANDLKCSEPNVRLWRRRFSEQGIEGLEEGEGRGRSHDPWSGADRDGSQHDHVPGPKGATHRSTRALAAHLDLSHATVQRIREQHRLQPRRSRSFKFSQDPELVAKGNDVIGLYLDPSKNAIVLSVDEKSQIQPLGRTQPLLPLRPRQPERRTHDHKRNGITTLFAAIDVATGEVTGCCWSSYGMADSLDHLKLLHRTYPRQQLHLILDNYQTHKNIETQRWLEWHSNRHPFVWVKTADEVLMKASPKAILRSVY